MVAIANLLNMYKPPILFLINRRIMYTPYMQIQAIAAAEQEFLNEMC